MKKVWLSLAALVAVSAIFAACGDDDDNGSDGGSGDQTSAITTNKGPAVQALVANITGQNIGGAEAGTGSDDLASGAAPAADVDSSNRSVGGGLGSDAGALPAQVSDGGGGITVQGYGQATADADSAVIDLYFGGNFTEPKPIEEPVPGDDGSVSTPSAPDFPPDGTVEPITEADLQPVIDALVAAGVARDDIEFVDPGYYDPYYASATLRATVNDISIVDGAVDAATNAAAGLGSISLQSSSVMYTLEDCSALEAAALAAAVEDAQERGGQLATALSVELGGIVAAADYSYYGYGGTGCGSSTGYPVPYYDDISARGSSSTQVQVFEQISITYAIQ